MKSESPSIGKKAFSCPHCRALAHQTWFRTRAISFFEGQSPSLVAYGDPSVDATASKDPNISYTLFNAFVARCFSCKKISLWAGDRMIFPESGKAPPPNPDLPEDILRDYEEASTILDLSPRGAAALIRLCIQKLCKHLGEEGKNINDDVGSLVAKGLDKRVQMALDAVRVIGNEAVHPGQMDLTDDRATAETLFGLLNIIAEKMISEPKHVAEVYAKLPQSKREQIEKRDGKT